jgi:hypothetical protein
MPYTKQKDRDEVTFYINNLRSKITTKGDLNYLICELTAQLIEKNGGMGYTNVSNWIDAVHGAETELRRRLLNPYEEVKKRENGDVPTFTRLLDQLK